MEDLDLISKYKNLVNCKVLDVGCNKGFFTKMFLEKDCKVTAFDIKDILLEELKTKVDFKVDTIENFNAEQEFDLIFARNVFPFTRTSLYENVNKYLNFLTKDGILFFTYFGDQEIWAKEGKLKGVSKLGIENILNNLDISNYKVLEFQELNFTGKAMDGEIKAWHQFRVLIQKLS